MLRLKIANWPCTSESKKVFFKGQAMNILLQDASYKIYEMVREFLDGMNDKLNELDEFEISEDAREIIEEVKRDIEDFLR